jgi:hypothetical protein
VSGYTPTTEEVRYGLCIAGGVLTTTRAERDARFDRWMKARDRKIKAKAWDEGYGEGHDDGIHDAYGSTTNPYREGA